MLEKPNRYLTNYARLIITNLKKGNRLFLVLVTSISLPVKVVTFSSVLNFIKLAFVESNYSERYVYEFFENVQNEQIINFVDERGEINSDGKFKLKALFEKYEDVKNMNSIIAANLEIDGVRTQMKNNIKGMMNNLNSLNV